MDDIWAKTDIAGCIHEGPPGTRSNDIGCDDDGRLYLIDRWSRGMHILEYTG